MPQLDRGRPGRIVQIEFEAYENFTRLPLPERVSIVLISNGKASILLSGKAVTLSAPSVLLLSHYDTLKLIEASQLAAKSFSFNPTFLNSALTFENLRTDDFSEIDQEHDRNMINLFLLRDEYYDGTMDISPRTYLRLSEWLAIMGTEVYAQSDDYWTCRIRRYLLQTLYLLDDIYMDRQNPRSVKREKSMVDIVLEYIHINYHEEISLALLCDLIHSNRTSLNRKFKEQTGQTAMKYLLNYRLKIACDALTHTNLTLSELAESIGFRYDTYFIRQFTQKMGVSPTDYRKDKRVSRY